MRAAPPFEADRFQSNIPYYAVHRRDFPNALVEEVIRRVGVSNKDRILDLGCGTGRLTVQLARSNAAEIVGMDPDPAMIAIARENAEAAKSDIHFMEGSSLDLSSNLGEFKLVTMARSFHWMDRISTLTALDKLVAAQGAVVLLSEAPEVARENRWKKVVGDLQCEFPGGALRGGPKHHATVLLDSAFSSVEQFGIIQRLPTNIDGIVGHAFSLYRSSPKVLGDQMYNFERELRRRLREMSPSGDFSEVIHFGALISRRPI